MFLIRILLFTFDDIITMVAVVIVIFNIMYHKRNDWILN
jgi:hypothetical protein